MLRTMTDRRHPSLPVAVLSVFLFFIHVSSCAVQTSEDRHHSRTLPSGEALKRYSAFRSDLGKRSDIQDHEGLSASGLDYLDDPSNLQFMQDVRERRNGEDPEMLDNEALNALTESLDGNDRLEKRFGQYRSDFGKRMFRSDFGKRMYRTDFGKRLYRSDFGKRMYRSDFGKRPYRTDLGKRLYRSDFGKRTSNDDDGNNYAGEEEKRSMFRSDLGKRRAGPATWWYNRRVFRSDLGKRSAFRSDLG